MMAWWSGRLASFCLEKFNTRKKAMGEAQDMVVNTTEWGTGWVTSDAVITLSGWKVRCFTYTAKGFLRFGRKSSMIKLPSSTRKASRTPLACRSAEIFRAPFIPDTCRQKDQSTVLLSQERTDRQQLQAHSARNRQTDSNCRLTQPATFLPSLFFNGAGPEIILSRRIVQFQSPSGFR